MNKRELKKLEILTIAENILTKHGSANFSMRELAKKCNYSLSSIQYYFPTMTDLLSALFDKNMDDVMTRFNTLQLNDNDQLEVLVNMIIDGFDDVSVCKLACEIWKTNDQSSESAGSKALRLFYLRYIKEVSNIIKQQVPNIDNAKLQQKVVMIISLFEGLLIIYPIGKNHFINFDLKGKVLDTVKLIINASN